MRQERIEGGKKEGKKGKKGSWDWKTSIKSFPFACPPIIFFFFFLASPRSLPPIHYVVLDNPREKKYSREREEK